MSRFTSVEELTCTRNQSLLTTGIYRFRELREANP